MKEIIFVTSNKGKVESAKTYFKSDVILKHYEYEIVEPEINDIEYIATFKVKQAYEKVKKPCISLDAGFYIPNFPDKPNFPGAFVRRELVDKLGIEGLLEKMKDVSERDCHFEECLAYYDGEMLKLFKGFVYGKLSTEIRGNDTYKKWSDLWYVFIPNNCTKTMAEMSDEERLNRKDGYVNPFVSFNNWYSNI